MKELSILGGATESFVMLYDKALLQVDGAGRYDVQASLDGEHWSVLTPITAKCDRHSRTIVLDLLAGAHIRVVCVTGTLESARYSFDMGETSEAERIAAEEARVEAENKRVEAENEREVAEAAREAAEAQREKKINDFDDAEATRVEKEIEREAAEAKRQATFTANEESRQSTFDANEEARQSVFNANEEKREEADALREERTNEAIASIADKVDRTDNAPELTAGFAGYLVGRGEATSEEIGFRPSGGLTSVNDGAARIERMKGNTVVWNQLRKNVDSTVSNGVSYSEDNKGVITASGILTNSYANIVDIPVKGRIGHKLLLLHENISNTDVKVWVSQNAFNPPIGTLVDIAGSYFSIYFYGEVGQEISFSKKIFIYDLTQMFGAGNEPTTIEEFNARKPLGVSDAYNEGELISTTADEIKSVGFNAWDGSREYGDIASTGTEGDTQIAWRSSYIRVLPNMTYIASADNESGGYIRCRFYTKDKVFISSLDGNNNTPNINTEFLVPQNAGYMRISPRVEDIPYDKEVCIHLVHTGYRNGEYEPYEEFRRSLPISEIKDSEGNALFPNGLLSAGSVYDEITATKAIKRIGVVDMGTLTWELRTDIQQSSVFITRVLGGIINEADNASIISSLYSTFKNTIASSNEATEDKTMYKHYQYGGSYNHTISIRDTSYTDAKTFNAAMSGVMLYYELAEPIEVDLEEPLNLDYEVSDFGTEEAISEAPTTPLKADIIYQFNAVDRVRENSLSLEDLIKRVAALEAQNAALVQQLNATGNGETE